MPRNLSEDEARVLEYLKEASRSSEWIALDDFFNLLEVKGISLHKDEDWEKYYQILDSLVKKGYAEHKWKAHRLGGVPTGIERTYRTKPGS